MGSPYEFMALCLFLAAHSATAAPGAPKPCCPPLKFEAETSIAQGQGGAEGTEALIMEGTIHVDYTDKSKPRVAAIEKLRMGANETNIRIIEVIEEKIMYIVTNGKTCNKMPLPFPASDDMCMAKHNSTYKGTKVLGGVGGSSLEVHTYEASLPGFSIQMVLSADKCIPIFQSIILDYPAFKMVQGLMYSGVEEGIKDPSVFDIPGFCKMPNAHVEAENSNSSNEETDATSSSNEEAAAKSSSSGEDSAEQTMEEVLARHRMKRAIWA